MRYLVFFKNKMLHTRQDEDLEFIRQKTLSQEEPQGVREYSPIVGWFLSLFNIAFRAYDMNGKKVWLDRKSFCLLLLQLKQQARDTERVKSVLQSSAVVTPDSIDISPPVKGHEKAEVITFDLSNVMEIFKKEMQEMKYSQPEDDPHLIALYDVCREELRKEIDRLEQEYFPDEEYITSIGEKKDK